MKLEKVMEFGNAYGGHEYYKGVNCFFSINVWPDLETEIKNLLSKWDSGEIKMPEELTKENQNPLALYSVRAHKSSLDPSGIKVNLGCQNMSLYEFCGLILKEQIDSIPKATRSAYIQHDSEDVDITIACEPFDNESDLTKKNLNIIYKEITRLTPELKKIFGEDIEIETEVYN